MSLRHIRRLRKDFASVEKVKFNGRLTDLGLMRDNLMYWSGILWPANPVYNFHGFRFQIIFSDKYPDYPPCVYVTTKIYHPNIHFTGWMYLPLLQQGCWKTSVRMIDVLKQLVQMVNLPDLRFIVNKRCGQEYMYKNAVFFEKAWDMAHQFGIKRPKSIARNLKSSATSHPYDVWLNAEWVSTIFSEEKPATKTKAKAYDLPQFQAAVKTETSTKTEQKNTKSVEKNMKKEVVER